MAKSRSVTNETYSLIPGTATYRRVPRGAGRVTVETIPDLTGTEIPKPTITEAEINAVLERARPQNKRAETEIPAWMKLGLLGELLPKGTREHDPRFINEATRKEQAILSNAAMANAASDQAKLMGENAAFEAKPASISRANTAVAKGGSIAETAISKGQDISNIAKSDHGERSILAGLLTNSPGEIMGSQPVSGGWDRFFKILSKMGARNNVSLVQDFIMGNLDVTKDEAAVYANLVKQQNLEADRRLKGEDLSLRRAANEQRIAAEQQRLSISRERLAMSTWPNTKATIERVQDAIAAGLEDGSIKGGETSSWKNFFGLGNNEKLTKEVTDRVLAILRDSVANGTDMSIIDAANQAVGSSSSKAPTGGTDLSSVTKINVVN